jgi:integrase
MRGRKTAKTGRQPGGREKDSGRKHLTRLGVEKLIDAAKGSRNGTRDRCLLLLMFRHGLRGLQQTAGSAGHRRLESRNRIAALPASRLVTRAQLNHHALNLNSRPVADFEPR